MDQKTYRTGGILPSEARKKVIIGLGLGSAGAAFFIQVPYQFGMVYLADPDVLKIENVERHPLGKSYLGRNKAEATRDFLIKEKGVPAGSIVAVSKKAEDVLPAFTGGKVDLVVCAIDNKPACRYVSDWCSENNVPAIYVGVYPLGLGGEVIAVPTPREVCYRCAEDQRASMVLPPAYAHNYGVNPELLGGSGTADDPKAVIALMNSVTAIVSEMVPLAWRMLFPVKGEEVVPQIRFRALEGWVEVARIHQSSHEFSLEVGEFGITKGLLLAESNAKITPIDKEGYVGYQIRRQSWPKQVFQSARCPNPKHGNGAEVKVSDL